MFGEQVEIVRQVFESGSGLVGPLLQGAEPIEHPWWSLWHPECFIEELAAVPSAGSHSGRAGVARYFQQVGELFDELTFTPQEIVEGEYGVMAVTDMTGRSKAGVEVQIHIFQVFRLREGAIVYVTAYLDRHEALKAVGLEQ